MSTKETPNFLTKQASTPTDLSSIRTLFTAYAASLNIDLTFQNFSHELSSLPGLYAPPTGALLLAVSKKSEEAVGCIALRPLPISLSSTPSHTAPSSNHPIAPTQLQASPLSPEPTKNIKTAEIKRLYTLPTSRGLGIGKALILRILDEAKELGYEEVRLDTLPSMEGARRIYESLGFREVERYYDTPLEGTIFLGKRLER